MMKKYDYIFPKDNGMYWEEIRNRMEFITEVRIRAEKPILIYMKQKEVSIDQEGKSYMCQIWENAFLIRNCKSWWIIGAEIPDMLFKTK